MFYCQTLKIVGIKKKFNKIKMYRQLLIKMYINVYNQDR